MPLELAGMRLSGENALHLNASSSVSRGALIVRAATISRIEKAEPLSGEEPAVGEDASRWLWLADVGDEIGRAARWRIPYPHGVHLIVGGTGK